MSGRVGGSGRPRRGLWLAAGLLALAGASGAREPAPEVVCRGAYAQGGGAVCRTEPDARLHLGAVTTRADADGWVVVGFDRDAPDEEVATLELPDGRRFEHRFPVAKRDFEVSRIDGLPPEQVDRFTTRQLARIDDSSRRKALGDRSRAALAGFVESFDPPLEGRETSPFGAQRILNGVPKRPHYGVDIAAPSGTPIRAPADGIVSLADDDLYFEGAMIVIDHGQGLLSKYLHVSRIDVAEGQSITRGQVIGAVGSRGRATGPHLCWRLKWRDRNLDPLLWVGEP